MARTALTVRTRPSAYPGSGNNPLLDLAAFDTLDNTNGNTMPCNGKTGLVVYNQDASAHTVTLHSANDASSRIQDVTAYSIAAGHVVIFAEFPILGWNSGGGLLMNVDSNFAMSCLCIARAAGT